MSKTAKYSLVLTSFSLLLLLSYYAIQLFSQNQMAEAAYISREIETFPKRIVNGYLGLFFRFSMFGALAWLSLAGLVAATFSEKLRAFRPFLFALALSILPIAFLGYYNYRYALSLHPVLQVLAFGILAYVVTKQQLKANIIALSLVLLSGIGFASYFGFKRLKPLLSSASESPQQESFYTPNSANFPDPLTSFINQNLSESDRVLCLELPQFFFYTRQKGILYLPSSQDLFLKNGSFHLPPDSIPSLSHLAYLSNCNHLLIRTSTANTYPKLASQIKNQAELKYLVNGYYLFTLPADTTNIQSGLLDEN